MPRSLNNHGRPYRDYPVYGHHPYNQPYQHPPYQYEHRGEENATQHCANEREHENGTDAPAISDDDDLDSKPAAIEEARSDQLDKEHDSEPSSDPNENEGGYNSQNTEMPIMHHPPYPYNYGPSPPPPQIHPPPPYPTYHTPYPPPWHSHPPYPVHSPYHPYSPYPYPYPPPAGAKTLIDPHQRKLRKNAQSRHRAALIRSKISTLKSISDKTPQQENLVNKFEQRRQKKNTRTRQRAAEKKALIESILAKPENERSIVEIETLRVEMVKRKRKNENDRLRRVKMKELGFKVKPPGIEIRGHDDTNGYSYFGYNDPVLQERYGEMFCEDKLLGLEEVSELLMKDDDGMDGFVDVSG